jgi:beta-mannosidase
MKWLIFGNLAGLKHARMKHFITLLVLILSFNLTTHSQQIVNLSHWEFRQAGYSIWYKANVPGTIHTDLLSNGQISDPFFRTNEADVQWVDKLNWEYRTYFKGTDELLKAGNLKLIFEGLDTYADVYLNDTHIHSNTNMFVTSVIAIDKNLIKETNVLRIYFKSPVIEGLKELERFGMPLPADNDQSQAGGLGPVKVSIFTRKAPYHYGWDWGPRIVTSGIWRQAYLKVDDDATISDVFIKQISLSSKAASMVAEVEVNDVQNNDYQIILTVNGSVAATSKISQQNSSIPFTIGSPELWWPNGHGKQPLYTITAELQAAGQTIDRRTTNIGLREIKLIIKPDKEGESFFFSVNGKPVFAKGANYIPNDVFLPRVDTSKYEHIVYSAAKANMNMLRVWGGGIYENDLFYDLCDKYGIMVWQDFMFACAMYPGSNKFYHEVAKEAEDNIKRLRNHPCIALWCGNNEIEQAWGQYEEKRGWGWKQRYKQEERELIWKAYDTVFHKILPSKVTALNPQTPYWHSSPSAGMGKLAGHDNTSGDMHYWGVWHGNEPIESFRKYRARFMSEYGFQSFPEFETVKKYTSSEDWNINSPVMKAHQRSAIGNERISEYLNKTYNQPHTFEDFLYVSQLLQAEAMKMAIEAHRTDMPYCMGSLYWQLNDCWPVASWSGMDYYGRWKAMHYFAREAFKNQILSVRESEGRINIYGISDIEGTTASLRVNLMDFKGVSLWNRSYSVSLNSNSSKLLTSIDLDDLPARQHKNDALLSITLVKNDRIIDSDIYYLDTPKNLKLPFPDLNVHIRQKPGRFDIEITSKNLCKNLMLISEGNTYDFQDNFFDLLPGETRVVTVNSALTFDEFEKKLSYLHLQQACEPAK